MIQLVKMQQGGSLSTFQILKKAKNIPHFRGVFARTNLPRRPFKNDCSILNLDKASGGGTHWVAYIKKGKKVFYFDSYGNLKAPLELVKYFRGAKIFYNQDKFQRFGETNCGELCLKFLRKNVARYHGT